MEHLDDIRAALRQVPHVEAAWVFGSAARGNLRPSSDLDVAVLTAHPLSPEDKLHVIEHLAQLSGRSVDLIDLGDNPGPIVGRVLQEGQQLFCTNTSAYAELIKRWWFDQADWFPYRREILKARREAWIKH